MSKDSKCKRCTLLNCQRQYIKSNSLSDGRERQFQKAFDITTGYFQRPKYTYLRHTKLFTHNWMSEAKRGAIVRENSKKLMTVFIFIQTLQFRRNKMGCYILKIRPFLSHKRL